VEVLDVVFSDVGDVFTNSQNWLRDKVVSE
jgi:hypothetical protein